MAAIRDIVIIGAGPAGLTIAAIAGQLGLKTTLLESRHMGGDCLNYGCVPSKALIASARRAYECMHELAPFGLKADNFRIDFKQVHQHIQEIIQAVSYRDSQQRFEALGVEVIRDSGRFTGAASVQAGDQLLQARKFVITTGSHPFIPPVNGVERVSYLTNETVFQLKQAPEHLIVIGGGPIGCELAQAYRRLGSRVTVLERGSILPKDDPVLVDLVRNQLIADKVDLKEGVTIQSVTEDNDTIQVSYENNSQMAAIEGSHLLIATGRRPNVDGLGLDAAGIDYTSSGIKVDKHLRTTNKRVFAAGDVTGSYQFTHAAAYQAGIIIRNAIFRLCAKTDYHAMAWTTYTAPELAHVGLNEQIALHQGRRYKAVQLPVTENDRYMIERQTRGTIKVIVSSKGVVLGASIAAADADNLITPWIMAVQHRLTLKKLAELIVPYPTKGELVKQVASQFYSDRLFSPMMKRLARWLV